MKKSMIKIITAVVTIAMISTLVACTAKTTDQSKAPEAASTPAAKQTLVMGTNAEFEPFEYRQNNEIIGFDVDVSKLVATKVNKELKVEDMAFDSLIAALESGKIDFIAAGMSVTPERKEAVDFSQPYYSATQVIIVKKGSSSVKKADDLKGKKIGVQEGTTGDLYVTKEIEGAKLTRFKKAVDGAIDLANGKLDAVVLDQQPAKKIIEQNDKLETLSEELTKEEYAIAVKKGNTELLNAINETLAKMKSDGTYMELIKKYMPNDAASLAE